jgi:RNA polymerase sigma-70 factor, ECF subfamily
MARSGLSSDAELLTRTAAGDGEAFGLFYDRFESELLRFLMRAVRRADLAADLCAEVFAAALGSAGSYRPELGSPRSWLFGIARHELADAWERGRVQDAARRRLELEKLVLGDAALSAISSLADAEGSEALSLLEELPADQRAAVHGRVIEEREYGELAVSLECSQSVVRQRVSRGLRSLRARLELMR